MKKNIWLIFVLATFAITLVWLLSQPLEFIGVITKESGPIETASYIGFAVCAVFIWIRFSTDALTKLLISLLMLVLTARELDFDKKFFTRGLFKSSQYLKDDVSGGEKILSATILIGIIGAFIFLIFRERQAVFSGLHKLHAGMVALATTFVFALVAKSLDGIGRKLAPFGIHISPEAGRYFGGIEELMELAIVGLFLVVIMSWPSRQ